MEGYLPAMPGPVHAFFVARRYRTPGQSKGRSASRAGRPIVVPFGFCGTTVFRVFQEVTVAEGFFGERGGSATFIENQ
jgi:hypothetical protein